MKRVFLNIGDILGGFTGAAVALPQAVGLGVVLFTAMGLSASSGALAGLLGAIVLQFIVGGVAATIGIISAPNGPMTMLLVGVMQTLSAQGTESDIMLATLSFILVATGVFQILFSLAGGTSMIKYIPYPVIAGLVAGVGILMLKSQWDMIAGEWEGNFVPHTLQDAFALIVAVATVAVMLLVPNMTKRKIPAAIAGLLGGIPIYFLLLSLLPVKAMDDWVVGEIPSAGSLHFGFDISAIGSLPVQTIIGAALALTILGTVDSLVTSLVADSKTGFRHDSKKEIFAQGLSGITIGLLGGLGGWGTKGATIVSTEAGGRRWAPVMAGVVFLALMLFAGNAGKYLPVSVLAAIVGMVGYGMIDWNIFRWISAKETRQDALVAILVIVVTLAASLIIAVAAGVVLSAIVFIYKDASRPVIHRRVTGTQKRSNCNYPTDAIDILERHGNEIVMYELRGDLFFGTADRLRSAMEKEFVHSKTIILHLRRVNYIDMSAMIMLLQIASSAKKSGTEIVYCHLHEGLGFGRKVERAFEQIDSRYTFDSSVFQDGDSAFEYAEKSLLKRYGYEIDSAKEISLRDNNLCEILSEEQIELIESIGHIESFGKEESVFSRGEDGEKLYLLLKGEVELRLPLGKESYKRVIKYEPGSYFGEMGFIHPSKREADAVAVYPAKLFVLSHSSLKKLPKEELSTILLALLYRFSRDMNDTIKFAAEEIRRLEEW